MLQPKKTKYRKQFRGKNRGRATRGSTVDFGDFGIQATTRGYFTARQIEAARKVIAQTTKRAGKTWIRIFPDKPVTKKAVGVKMGSGKGDIHEYVAVIKPDRVLFELGGVPEAVAREAFRKAGHKIPMQTKFVTKAGYVSGVTKIDLIEAPEIEEDEIAETEVESGTEGAADEAKAEDDSQTKEEPAKE